MSADIDSKNLIFPGLAGLYQKGSPYAYAFMRFATGAVLVPHGVQKVLYTPVVQFSGNIAAQGFPAPLLLAYLTYFTELVAAACLALGLFTRIAALMIWIEMALSLRNLTGSSATSGPTGVSNMLCYGCCSAPRSCSAAAAATLSTG